MEVIVNNRNKNFSLQESKTRPLKNILQKDIQDFPSEMETVLIFDTPPMELVSICTTESDTDSISSISIMDYIADGTEEDDLQSQDPTSVATPDKPRSIFGDYWTKEGVPKPIIKPSAHQLKQQCPTSPRAVTDYPCQEQFISYEKCLKELEPCDTTSFRETRPYDSRPLSCTKGTWWKGSWFTSSSPTLLQNSPYWNHGLQVTTSRCQRGFFSDSVLPGMKKPKKSCLRSSRFSSLPTKVGNSCIAKESKSTGGSVSFQDHVDVIRFQPPTETWAQEGWSSWFNYKSYT